MASETKKELKEALKTRLKYENDYRSLFSMLYHNAVEVEDLPEDLPKRYLLRVLKNRGGIAYDKITKLYLPYSKVGIDVYGLPKQYILVGYDGYVITRDAKDVVILRANDNEYSLDEYIENQVKKIVDYDIAIEQNLEAIKTMSVAQVADLAQLNSLVNFTSAKRIGATIVYVNKSAFTGSDIKVQQTGAQYLIDKLRQDRKECMNETLSTIGINVANVDKRERVQDAEIRASQGFALDCINTLVQTFNHDAEIGGLKIRLKAKTSLVIQNELDILKKKAEIKDLNSAEGENNEQ